MKSLKYRIAIIFLAVAALPHDAHAQTTELVPVVQKPVSRMIDLPGEFEPFQTVDLHARVTGFVEKVLVDRGSVVKQGDLLVELSAPEMKAQIAEAESKVQIAEAERLQAEAKLSSLQATLASLQATYDRLKTASQTPGAIAGNELDVAFQSVEGQRASIQAQRSTIEALRSGKTAAEAAVRALKEMETYLTVTAPFDGVVSERDVHTGALVGPGSAAPMLVLQQVARLRLVVSVPEEDVAGIVRGASVSFGVPAYPGRTFSGTVARLSPALDQKTRSMPVELDVANTGQTLAPGMYPAVHWPVRSSEQAFYVPKTSVVTTTERTFVIREKSGRAEWVNVQKGPVDGDLIRVLGPLQSGDRIVKRANDELREGTVLQAGK